jgi:UDP-N-acetyl-2-amino-2-deoxyglucuronate dehydrogenase
MSKNFAIIGVGGYVAPRHLKAIKETGNQLVAAVDPKDSVGILDQFSFGVRFFPEFERFDRHLEKLRRGPESSHVHYISVCSPNYLHDAHIRLALRIGADAICEKPLVINPWNLDGLGELEKETGRKVNTILQLRVHPALAALKKRLESESSKSKHDVVLTYITARGPWYSASWKGSSERSGGLAMNIGIHFFDLVMWLFGGVKACQVHLHEADRMAGFLELANANVRWYLSVNTDDLPFDPMPGSKTTFRSITVDSQEVEFSEGFTDLHTLVYKQTLEGNGFGIDDARPSIELVHTIRTCSVVSSLECAHPHLLAKERSPRQ